jgi:hypothetical protein
MIGMCALVVGETFFFSFYFYFNQSFILGKKECYTFILLGFNTLLVGNLCDSFVHKHVRFLFESVNLLIHLNCECPNKIAEREKKLHLQIER